MMLPRALPLRSLSLQPVCEPLPPIWKLLEQPSFFPGLKSLEITDACHGYSMHEEMPPEDCYRLDMEDMLAKRTGLTSLRVAIMMSPWVNAGSGGALSKMSTLERLSVTPVFQFPGLSTLVQLQRVDLKALDHDTCADPSNQMSALAALPSLIALRLTFLADCNYGPDNPAPPASSAILQAVGNCTSLVVLHVYMIHSVTPAGLADLTKLQRLASLVLSTDYRDALPVASVAAMLQRLPQLRFFDMSKQATEAIGVSGAGGRLPCKLAQGPRTFTLQGLPGRRLVRYPLGGSPFEAWHPGWGPFDRLAGLDF